MVSLARITLWAVIVGGVSCFCLITFMRPTVWYITDQVRARPGPAAHSAR